MPHWGYSFKEYDPATMARASVREIRVSPKASVEVCRAVKGLTIEEARRLLEDVIAKERPIPFRRYKKKVAHKRGLQGWYAGRYPVKVARAMLKLLDSLEANAEQKGLDLERLRIIHAAAYGGMKLKRYMPRAFGRSSPKFETLTHIELVAKEV